MTQMFEGKVVAITGAGRGIGREMALLFARYGAQVVVNDLGGGPVGGGADGSIAQAVVDEIAAAGGEAVAETSSIASMAGGQALVDKAIASFGRLDFLINNAGIVRPSPIREMTEEDFDIVLAVNLKGYFATIKAAVEHIIKARGAIVNFSSPSGWGHWGMVNYGAAKEAVVGMTRALAREMGEHGVRVNAVRPVAAGSAMDIPAIHRTLQESERLGLPLLSNQHLPWNGVMPQPGNVAALATWLCTDYASVFSGREFYIAGSEVAIVAEPDLTRAHFNTAGWSFEALCEPEIVRGLTYNQHNLYAPKAG
ncbi:MAG TPA: SDR family NAD(P)-dependent oxidoreductase [Novosphingobium sp.]